MSRYTSFDELYLAVGAVLERATGRRWWRKGSIQAQPKGTYATVVIASADGLQNAPVSQAWDDASEQFVLTPWVTSLLDVRIDFIRSAPDDTALQAANRFRSALCLEERMRDLGEICGLVGHVSLLDVSAAFRADTEPRVEVKFQAYANLSLPLPLAGLEVPNIRTEDLTITHRSLGGVVTEQTLKVEGAE